MPEVPRRQGGSDRVDHLPLHLNLKGRSCLVVGGGALAQRKIELLLRAGAKVCVVAKSASAAVKAWADQGLVELQERAYASGDVQGRRLVVAATDDAALHARIFAHCEGAGVLLNTVDAPALCSAIFPAIVDRGAVQVSVSTSGRSPTLARLVRGWLEARLPPALGGLAAFAAARRERVRAALPDPAQRRRFWDRIIGGAVAEKVLGGQDAEEAFAAALRTAQTGAVPGLVALVGAGPGDPELITLRGLRLLQQADVVLYDNLVERRILDYARRDAERIYVGKRVGERADAAGKWVGESADAGLQPGVGGAQAGGARQAAINALLVRRALAGEDVVRLKGGDPFIFGRGGEEVETLAAQGIDLVVVPGITAALGAASYAGVPLTHRQVAQSVRFVTGHRVHGQVNLDWSDLVHPHQTLVVYMGLLGLPQIVTQLIAQGMRPQTPALLIERATLPDQREIEAPIQELPAAVAKANVKGPTLIIIGEVINHRRTAG